jgi:hypothetical protein
MQVHAATVPLLFTTWTAYVATYLALVWYFDLLNSDERQAIARFARKLQVAAAEAFRYGKG